jgi:DNA-binding response OmpR family regulator
MSASRPLVVVIDDAPEVRLLLETVLKGEGFRVSAAADGQSGLDLIEQEPPDLVVLDLVMPGMDGLEVCQRIRSRSDVYVILLTARGSQLDRVVGLTVGADDYLVKPFSTAELVARLRAMLRRPRRSADAVAAGIRRIADLELDLEAREVRKGGAPVHLTRIEFALLEALTDNPRRVQSREQLLARIWGREWSGESHLIDVHISKLRRKLDQNGEGRRYVLTVRGAGYRMDDAGPADRRAHTPPPRHQDAPHG